MHENANTLIEMRKHLLIISKLSRDLRITDVYYKDRLDRNIRTVKNTIAQMMMEDIDDDLRSSI